MVYHAVHCTAIMYLYYLAKPNTLVKLFCTAAHAKMIHSGISLIRFSQVPKKTLKNRTIQNRLQKIINDAYFVKTFPRSKEFFTLCR